MVPQGSTVTKKYYLPQAGEYREGVTVRDCHDGCHGLSVSKCDMTKCINSTRLETTACSIFGREGVTNCHNGHHTLSGCHRLSVSKFDGNKQCNSFLQYYLCIQSIFSSYHYMNKKEVFLPLTLHSLSLFQLKIFE